VLQARAGSHFDPILAFVAPKNGKLRVDCDRIVNNGQAPARMAILKNKEDLWPREGFEIIEPAARVNGGALFIKPIVTYAGPAQGNKQP
jgi:hypothetical protein